MEPTFHPDAPNHEEIAHLRNLLSRLDSGDASIKFSREFLSAKITELERI
jgi:hypothetical protein